MITNPVTPPSSHRHPVSRIALRTADEVYVRFHGPKRWYRHDYSDEELADWATKIRDSGAKRAWVYFNNDFDAYAPKNAAGIPRTCSEHKAFVENERAGDQPFSLDQQLDVSSEATWLVFLPDVTSAVAGLSVRRNSSSHAEHVLVASISSLGMTEDGRWRTTS